VNLHSSRYLFATEYTTQQLELSAAKFGSRGLLELFPSLVVAVARISPIWDQDEEKIKHNSKPNLLHRRCRARNFQPMKPIDFMNDIVMGTERDLKEFEESREYLSIHGTPIDQLSDVARQEWLDQAFGITTRQTGSIVAIQFEPGGHFLPDTPEEVHLLISVCDRLRVAVRVFLGIFSLPSLRSSGSNIQRARSTTAAS
jgi:hypothetical protein